MNVISGDEYFMKEALKEARKAYDLDEVPIGAVLVCNDKIICRSYNQVEMLKDSTAHAEILAITSASAAFSSKYLPDFTLYVTIEPCVMCAGAIHWSQISKVVYGAIDLKKGYSIYNPEILKNTELKAGILEEECASILKDFFRAKR